jgi:hypothetical protein
MLCALSMLAIAPGWLRAQTPPAALPPTPTTTTPAPALTTPTVQKKGLSLRIPSGPLASAVDELLQAAKGAQLPEINVIYGPGVADVPVPELSIRNVSAADGLRLIATSAGCATEPILSAQDAGTIIGYKVDQPAPSPKTDPALFSSGVTTSHFGGGGLGNIGYPVPRDTPPLGQSPGDPSASRRGNYAPTASNKLTLVKPSPPSAALNLTGDGRIISMGLNPQNPVVRIYPLGTITSTVKFPDIEATLHDVLKAEGAAADSTKLAVHEKTNVLVVTGPPQTQELVNQYVEALQKNQSAAQNAESVRNEVTGEITKLRIELQAQEREKARLNDQLAKTEAELRTVQQDFDRLKVSAGKSQ